MHDLESRSEKILNQNCKSPLSIAGHLSCNKATSGVLLKVTHEYLRLYVSLGTAQTCTQHFIALNSRPRP
jgi:hypothetical protein